MAKPATPKSANSRPRPAYTGQAYPITDHTYDVVVVGAGGAGLRATVGALRYVTAIGAGAAALALEGPLYDIFHDHGPALQWLLASIPITLAAILFLPEPAGRTLEEMA